ncbi:MAG: class I SAM-dependent RNA methyltransferase [Nitrospirota bacterium]
MPDKIIPTITIEKLVYGGSGLAHDENGKAIFVPATLPKETVRVKVIREKKDYAEGYAEEILVPSPERRQPECPVFGICGGCQIQHLSESGQASHKNEVLSGFMRQIKQTDPFSIDPIVTSPLPFHYRLRGQFVLQKGQIGFYRRESHTLVPIDQCPLMVPAINHAISFFNAKGIDLLTKAYKGAVLPNNYDLEIQGTEAGEVLFVLRDPGNSSFSEEKMTAFFEQARMAGGTHFSLQGGIVYSQKMEASLAGHGAPARGASPARRFQWGQDFLTYPLSGGKMRVRDRTFVQVNLAMLEPLRKGVMAWADDKNARWLEIHAGAGFFTLPLSETAASVVSIEANPISVQDAEWNLAAAGRKNVQMIASLGGNAMARFPAQSFTHLLLDPPRSGMTDMELAEIVRIAPRKILYLSCHPATLIRDIKRFSDSGYRVRRVLPFDLFPQTGHLEVLVELGGGII